MVDKLDWVWSVVDLTLVARWLGSWFGFPNSSLSWGVAFYVCREVVLNSSLDWCPVVVVFEGDTDARHDVVGSGAVACWLWGWLMRLLVR